MPSSEEGLGLVPPDEPACYAELKASAPWKIEQALSCFLTDGSSLSCEAFDKADYAQSANPDVDSTQMEVQYCSRLCLWRIMGRSSFE